MKRSYRFLLAGSLFLLAGCTWVMGLFGYDPALTKEIQEDGHRLAHDAADSMALIYEMLRLAAAWFGGMVTVPATRMMKKGVVGTARKALKMMKRKPKAKRKP